MTVVIHDRDICIGCAACAAVCPSHWKMADDGKSDLIDAEQTGPEKFKKEIPDSEYDCNMEAAKSCPVNCIHIEKNGTREI